MSGANLFLIELLIFSGAALAWAAYELWTVRRKPPNKEPPEKP